MEELIKVLLTGEITVEKLLVVACILWFTKRVYPYWEYEALKADYDEAIAKLKETVELDDLYLKGYRDGLGHVNLKRKVSQKRARRRGRRAVSRRGVSERASGRCEGCDDVV